MSTRIPESPSTRIPESPSTRIPESPSTRIPESPSTAARVGGSGGAQSSPSQPAMSSALVWELVKNNNAFLVKRERTNRSGAVQFSREAGNLLGVNTAKYSGLANDHTVGLSSDLVLTKKVNNLFILYLFSIWLFINQ
jgi:hypothetical protein